ncbi:hypothetical protein BDFG_02828 [Blastomyces dermatitidis ATCC 26199]|nr:hypothetical protein BDFG_02828 [Blastomyces dermatitidis ATCC 26199]
MSDCCQASHEHPRDSSDHFLLADEAGALLLMTMSSSLSALPPHPIFRPAAHPLPLSDQFLASSSAVPLFALTVLAKLLVLSVSSAVSQAYDHLSPARTISDQTYANMPRFSINDPRAAAHFHNLIINER